MNETTARRQLKAAIRRRRGAYKALLTGVRQGGLRAAFLPSEAECLAEIRRLDSLLSEARLASPKSQLIDWDRNGNSYSAVRTALYFAVGEYRSPLFGSWGV